MKFTTTAAAALLAAAATAAPTAVEKRATSICGQWDSVATGSYTLYQDLWNEDAGTGSQCSEVTSLSGNDIAWSTTWNWSGGAGQVKSYANIVTKLTSTVLSGISSIATTWDYSYTGSDIIADVSYDMFTSATAGGSNAYEIMVWLAALGGAGPISSTGSPVATPTIGGVSFKLYSGPNGDTTVFSFVAVTEQTKFSGDLKEFLTYLINNEGLSASQYLTSIGAGTEPFSGSDAVLTVSQFSCVPVYGTASTAVVATTKAATTSVVKATSVATSATKATSVATKATTTTAAAKSTGAAVAKWGQCGGSGYTGATACVSGSTCTVQNEWYSQCL